MAKKAGVPLIKNWKKRQSPSGPKQPVKQRLAKPKKSAVVFDEDSSEEGLEDTPVFRAQPETPVEKPAVLELQEATPAAVLMAESPVLPVAVAAAENTLVRSRTVSGKRSSMRRAKKDWFSGAIHSALSAVINLFSGKKGRSKGNAAALAFAGNNRRVGKKGRRNRRILVYAGSGLAVIAVVLFVLLVPGGAAAPVDAPEKTDIVANVSESTTIDNAGDNTSETVSATSTVISTPSSTPVPTTVAEPTDNPIDMDELLDEYVVKADLYYNEVGYSNNTYSYTEADVYTLAQVIYGEARGETRDGKIAVGNVVMNRVLSRRAWPNTISGVVTAPRQFTGYKASIVPDSRCRSAARMVLQYEFWVIPQNVYFFRSGAQEGVDWGGHEFYKKVGGHCFYYETSYGRSNRVPPALFERTYKYAQFGCQPEERVVRIQSMLNSLGYKIAKIDGYFGKGTKEALIKFQNDHGLDDDGVAGPATVKRLIEEYGVRDYYAKFCT